jgi:N-acylneuraminate cytidylyltransferase/CMP-N,N'-diacetyllegionaminic acid synthase
VAGISKGHRKAEILIQSRSLLAIIPARGGSKTIKDKNIRSLAGRPLIAWTIEAAKTSKYVDRVVVSTDSEAIAGISKTWGADVPFLRPPDLATDEAPGNDVIVHCLRWIRENEPRAYDFFIYLQPTSPLRTSAHIDAAMEQMVGDPAAEALVSVAEAADHPYWLKIIDDRGRLASWRPDGRPMSRRQDLPKLYILNGAIYIARPHVFDAHPDFYAGPCLGFVMDRTSSVDIDDENEFAFAEFLLNRRSRQPS